ncbi:unnamed protein product [Ectocarpus fasciculatus]
MDLNMVSEAGHNVAGLEAAAAASAEAAGGGNSSAPLGASHDPSGRHGSLGDEAIGDSKAGKCKRQHTYPEGQEARRAVPLDCGAEYSMGVDAVALQPQENRNPSSSSTVSVAGGEPTAQLPAPAPREAPRPVSSSSMFSLPPVSASGGQSQAHFRPEWVSTQQQQQETQQ